MSVNSRVEQLLDTIWVKSYDDLLVDHRRGSGATVIRPDKLKHRNLVLADVLLLKLDSPLREEDLHGPARWSARLYEYDNLLRTHHTPPALGFKLHRTRPEIRASTTVIRYWLWMDQHAKESRLLLLETNLQGSLDVMHAPKRQIV